MTLMVVVIAKQRTRVVTLMEIQPVLDPLLLHEFELAKQVRTNNHHNNALLSIVGFVGRL